MADEKELKQMNKNGILIYQLRPEDTNVALSHFPEKYIEKVSNSSKGLHIFFKDYDLVRKSILRQNIEVRGYFYNIFPLVTNLTICGIGRYATNSTIENIMQKYGLIIDSYGIQETTKRNGYKTVSLTNDYRIILDIPEVLAPKLKPITLPDTTHRPFEVLYFCRLCRSNGHMQFQCPKFIKNSPSSFICHQIKDDSRRMSYESDSSDFVVRNNGMNRPQADFYVDQRNSRIHPHSQEKPEKEHKNVSSHNTCCKNKPHNIPCHQNKEVSKKISYETDSSDLMVKNKGKNSPRSDMCADRRNSKIHSDYLVKPKKEQNYSSDQKSYSKNKSGKLSNHHSKDVSRRISYESDSSDLTVKGENKSENSPRSDMCADRRNSKIHSDYLVKPEKEQNCLSDQKNYSKNKSSKLFSYHSKDVSRKISYESDSSDLMINDKGVNRPRSDVDRQNSKIRLDSLMKSEKEQTYLSDQNRCCKKTCRNIVYHQNKDVSRRISHENDSLDLTVKNKRIKRAQSDNYADQRNSKNRDDFQTRIEEEQNYFSKSPLQPEKEQNCFTNKNNCSKNINHKFTCHQNKDVFRRTSQDSVSSDSTVNQKRMKRAQSNISVDPRNYKSRDDFQVKSEEERNYLSDSQMESEKEQTCFSNQNICSKSEDHSCTCHQNRDIVKKISHEEEYSDIADNNKRKKLTQSDFYDDQQNSKNRGKIMVKIEEETYFSDSQMEPEKEQNCFSNQNNCSENEDHSFTCHQNRGVFRRKSHENYCTDLKVNHKRVRRTQSDIYVGRQNYKNRDEFQVKTEKEQNYFSHKNCPKKKSHKNDVLKNCTAKSSHSKSKDVHETADNMEKNHSQENFSSIPGDDGGEKFRDKNSSASSSEILKKRKCSKGKYFPQHFENEEDTEGVQPPVSNDCNDNQTLVTYDQRRKEAIMRLLSNLLLYNLLPPNTDLPETVKLIQVALKCQNKPKDIPEEVKTVLLGILKYNRELKMKDVNEEARFFLNWIKKLVNKIEKFENEKYHVNLTQHPLMEKEPVKGGTSLGPKQQSLKKRAIELSVGIREAILKTDVVEIQPELLCNFLNHVRGRRKWLEVVSAFTENIPGLASQLLEVVKTYYKYVQRGPKEDRDIRYIKGLRKKLLLHSKNTTQTSLNNKGDIIEVNFKTESDVLAMPVKTEPDITEMTVKTELDIVKPGVETEVNFKTESDVTEMSVKIEPGTTRMDVEADMTEIFMKQESSMEETAVKAKLDMTEHVKHGANITEIPIKKETEMFVKQSSSSGDSFNENLSFNGLYGASYFTNIAKMPFSFTSIKTEVNDVE